MFPSNPNGIETHQNFPRGCPPQPDGQHFVPTPDFSDQQRSIHQTSGHYAPNHNEIQHGPIFQNRVWNRPDSQNIEKDEYINMALNNHLLDPNTYRLLSPLEAHMAHGQIRTIIRDWIKAYKDVLSKNEEHFSNDPSLKTRIPLEHYTC
jgi:hypothetical protein